MGIVPQSLRKHFARYLEENAEDVDATFSSLELAEGSVGGGGGLPHKYFHLTGYGDGSVTELTYDLSDHPEFESGVDGVLAATLTSTVSAPAGVLEDTSLYVEGSNIRVTNPDPFPDGGPIIINLVVVPGDALEDYQIEFGPGSGGGVS